MPADSIYRVGIEFSVDDLNSKLSGISSRLGGSDLFKPFTGGLKAELAGIGNIVGDIGGRLSDTFTGAVERAGELAMTMTKLGGLAAVGAVTYGVAGLNSELEKTRISFADIFTANGVAGNMTEGLGMAADIMSRIRKDAAALPGETADLAQIVKLASIPGLRAGAGINRIEALSANAMAYGMGTVGLDGGTTSRELSMLLSGRAGAHNVLGANLGLIGGDAQRFNKQTGAQQFAEVEKLLSKHSGSIDLYAKSYEGLFSTMKDNSKLLLSTATAPLFENAKVTLGQINDWFDRNRGDVLAWSTYIGTRLSDAFEGGKLMVSEWWPAIETFAENAYHRISGIWERVGPYVDKFAGSVKAALGDPATMDKLESILKLYGEVKLGSLVMPFAKDGFSLGSKAAGLFGGLGSAGGAGSSMMGLVEALPLLAVSGGALVGVFDDLTDSTNGFHTAAMKQLGGLKESFDLINGSDLKLVDSLKSVADALGMVTLDAANLAGALITLPERMTSWTRKFVPDNFDGSLDHDDSNAKLHLNGSLLNDYSPMAFRSAMSASADREKDRPKLPTTMATTVHQTINMTISGAEEPSRVARIVTQKLAESSRFPTTSRYAGVNFLTGRRT